MSKTIPLIRAGAMIPIMRWMATHHRPLERYLREADLGYMTFIDPNQPIPLRNVAQFFVNSARREGPDIGCQIVSETTLVELAFIGKVVLGAKTPSLALGRVVAMMPYHSSHEAITLRRRPEGIAVSDGWAVSFEDETLHVIQQFFGSIIQRICNLTRAPEPLLHQFRIVPHPEFGLSHLNNWFGQPPEPSPDRAVHVFIDTAVADRPFFKTGRDRAKGPIPPGMEPLVGNGTLSGSAKAVLASHLIEGTPTIDRLAVSAGLARRTLQRNLAAEGTSFSDLLEEVRRDLALRQLESGSGSIDDVAARLGYTRQSTLTRAVRRWTGNTPSTFRQHSS